MCRAQSLRERLPQKCPWGDGEEQVLPHSPGRSALEGVTLGPHLILLTHTQEVGTCCNLCVKDEAPEAERELTQGHQQVTAGTQFLSAWL